MIQILKIRKLNLKFVERQKIIEIPDDVLKASEKHEAEIFGF